MVDTSVSRELTRETGEEYGEREVIGGVRRMGKGYGERGNFPERSQKGSKGN